MDNMIVLVTQSRDMMTSSASSALSRNENCSSLKYIQIALSFELTQDNVQTDWDVKHQPQHHNTTNNKLSYTLHLILVSKLENAKSWLNLSWKQILRTLIRLLPLNLGPFCLQYRLPMNIRR